MIDIVGYILGWGIVVGLLYLAYKVIDGTNENS